MYKDIVHKVECAVQRVHVVHSFPTSSADKTYRCTLHWCCTQGALGALHKECMLYRVFQHRLLTRFATVHCIGAVHKLFQVLQYKGVVHKV